MQAKRHKECSYVLVILALMVTLESRSGQTCWTASGPECEKAPFVPGHNLAGEGFDVVRMRRTGAYVINVKGHMSDNHTCTLCPNRFQQGQVQKCKSHQLQSHSRSTLIPSYCSDSETPSSRSGLAPLQPLQQAALQRPPPLCGLSVTQFQLPGQQQLGCGFESGEYRQRRAGRKPLRPGKIRTLAAQRGQGHVCHPRDQLHLLQVKLSSWDVMCPSRQGLA